MKIGGRFLTRPGAPPLFVRTVVGARAPARAYLLLVHASMVHSEYYLPLAAGLAEAGIAVWLPDLRGHGRSGGVRGHVRDWREHVQDVHDAFSAMTALSAPGTPCLLAGESYGGLVAYLALKPGALAGPPIAPTAAALLSPALGLAHRLSTAQRWWLTRVGHPLFPRLRPPRPLSHVGISQDPYLGQLIDADSMTSRRYTLGFLVNLLDAQQWLTTPPVPGPFPILALLSAGDEVCDNEVPLALFARQPSVTTRILPAPRHSLVADLPDRLLTELFAFVSPMLAPSWSGRSGSDP